MTTKNQSVLPAVPAEAGEVRAPELRCGDLLGLLRELAAEQRSCAAQCIHAYKAKAMYESNAVRIETGIAGLEKAAEKIAAQAWRDLETGLYNLGEADVRQLMGLDRPNTADQRRSPE